MLVTLRNGKKVDVTPANAASVADEAIAAQHSADAANGRAVDPNLDLGIRNAIYNSANGTGGAVSGVDVPDETPVDWLSVPGLAWDHVTTAFDTGLDEIKKGLPTLDPAGNLTFWIKTGVIVAGLGFAAYIVFSVKKVATI